MAEVFDNSLRLQNIPTGLYLQQNVISSELESKIIQWLDTQTWSTELSRRTQHYGYIYNYNSKNIVPGPPIQGPLLDICNLFKNANIMDPTQCLVNEYYRNQGIAPHVDAKHFGPVICSLSLGNDTSMYFTNNEDIFQCFLPQRSLIMLTDDSRYKWKHYIPKTVTYKDSNGNSINKSSNYRRISLTFRTITN